MTGKMATASGYFFVEGDRLPIKLSAADVTTCDLASVIDVRDLSFEPCLKEVAVQFIRENHSRLPNCQKGPWMYAFRARFGQMTVATALWNNPSARTLPNNWLELRRLACSPIAPRNTCSKFLSWMVKYFRVNRPGTPKLISYQDTDVHSGTIYKAANWYIDYVGKPRYRDRTKPRAGTKRAYRSDINGRAAASSGKVRWAIDLKRRR